MHIAKSSVGTPPRNHPARGDGDGIWEYGALVVDNSMIWNFLAYSIKPPVPKCGKFANALIFLPCNQTANPCRPIRFRPPVSSLRRRAPQVIKGAGANGSEGSAPE